MAHKYITERCNKLDYMLCELIDKSENDSDVLTNETAYTAQQVMANGQTDYERLGGFIHRPEGFHRIVNFVLVCTCNSLYYNYIPFYIYEKQYHQFVIESTQCI